MTQNNRETGSDKLAVSIEAKSIDGDNESIVVDEQASLNDNLGESDIQLYDLPNGLTININRFVPAKDLTLAFDPMDAKPRMTSIMLLTGRTTLKFPKTGEYHFTPTRGYNMRYQGEPGTFYLAAGEEVRNFTVAAPPEILGRHLEGEVPQVLESMLDPLERTNAVSPFPVSQEMRRTVAQMISPGLTGRLREIQLESAALMYITMVARALQQEPPPYQGLTRFERKAVEDVHRQISESLRDPPSLAELSTRAGMSEKRLNNAFREVYGSTVFETLRDARLSLAKEMLEEGGIPIKSIAWNVGYAHVSNFNRAFTKMFGVTPGAVMSDKRLPD